MRLFAYYRVSTDAQGVSGNGLEAQKHSVEAYAAQRGHEIAYWVQEVASGGRDDRPLLRGALEALKRGEVDGLIFAKLDRLTRSLLHFAQIAKAADKQGWKLIAADGDIDMTTPAGKAMAGMLAVFAEFERNMISARTREGLQAKKRREGGKLKGNKPSVSPDVVERIRDLRVKHAMSYREIAEHLTRCGFPTAQGGKWRPGTVRYILEHAKENA